MIRIFENCDCMAGMEKHRDLLTGRRTLAIVDPEYGGKDAIGIKNGKSHAANRTEYHLFKNEKPPKEYFDALFYFTQNQIVWGGNYFGLSGGCIVWDKEGSAFGDGEIAYCSLLNSVQFFRYRWNGMLQQDMKNKERRIHPTQKPVALYRWLLQNYAKPGDLILDTHVGSASSLIACEIEGFELDAEYYAAASERIKNHRKQPGLFDKKPEPVEREQLSLLGDDNV